MSTLRRMRFFLNLAVRASLALSTQFCPRDLLDPEGVRVLGAITAWVASGFWENVPTAEEAGPDWAPVCHFAIGMWLRAEHDRLDPATQSMLCMWGRYVQWYRQENGVWAYRGDWIHGWPPIVPVIA